MLLRDESKENRLDKILSLDFFFKDSTTYCVHKIHFKYRDRDRLKVKEWETI